MKWDRATVCKMKRRCFPEAVQAGIPVVGVLGTAFGFAGRI
ncbi:hypothetical protein J2S00_000183 [Caldalkalibacillus uzonensis]|uniref:Uncharacterized protein n=1 Tax=Caldalkalibacillus uzonensis TaxID=353224 RepID=A0ABU0CMU8_9BACI|nr:hypothetical protein [Caldalkalibacillus uzonensis]MDQ0337413.1 hypothetical protein [Caldalkalibacillus uzonensis]